MFASKRTKPEIELDLLLPMICILSFQKARLEVLTGSKASPVRLWMGYQDVCQGHGCSILAGASHTQFSKPHRLHRRLDKGSASQTKVNLGGW